jgi:hypothetical protein
MRGFLSVLGVLLLSVNLIAGHVYERTASPQEMLVHMPGVIASYQDPASADFKSTAVRHALAERGVCTCTSKYKANIYEGDPLPPALITALEYAQCLWSCIMTGVTNGSAQLKVINFQSSGSTLATAGPYYAISGGNYIPCPQIAPACVNQLNLEQDIEMNVDPDAVSYYFGTDGIEFPPGFG